MKHSKWIKLSISTCLISAACAFPITDAHAGGKGDALWGFLCKCRAWVFGAADEVKLVCKPGDVADDIADDLADEAGDGLAAVINRDLRRAEKRTAELLAEQIERQNRYTYFMEGIDARSPWPIELALKLDDRPKLPSMKEIDAEYMQFCRDMDGQSNDPRNAIATYLDPVRHKVDLLKGRVEKMKAWVTRACQAAAAASREAPLFSEWTPVFEFCMEIQYYKNL